MSMIDVINEAIKGKPDNRAVIERQVDGDSVSGVPDEKMHLCFFLRFKLVVKTYIYIYEWSVLSLSLFLPICCEAGKGM